MRISLFYTLVSLAALSAATPMPKERLDYEDWKLCNVKSEEFTKCITKVAIEDCNGGGKEAAKDEICTGTVKFKCCKLSRHNTRMISAVTDSLIAAENQCKFPTKHNIIGEIIKGLEALQ